jgi:hypothetical protein
MQGLVLKGGDAYIAAAEGEELYKLWYDEVVPFRRRNRPQASR